MISLQDLFLKPRIVFAIDRERYEPRDVDHPDYHVGRANPSEVRDDQRAMAFLADHVDPGAVRDRIERDDCTLFLARERRSGDAVGFYWGLSPEGRPTWHDSFRVPPGSGLVFNAYVAEDHRRRGIYRHLQDAAHGFLFDREGCDTVYTIVERRNTPSIRANRGFGLEPAMRNYLVKLFGINVLSVLSTPDGIDAHVVLTKPHL